MTTTLSSQPTERLQFNREIRIPTDWGHLAAKVWGPDDGMPVLALHGWADNAGTFDKLAPLLPANTFLVCLDFCGHGLSSGYPPGIFLNYYDHVYHIKITIDYFKWSKVSIIGHSMGALASIYFCAIFPNLVDKFISLDSIKQLSAPPQYLPQRMNHVLTMFQKLIRRMNDDQPTCSYKEMRQNLIDNYNGSIGEEEADILLIRGSIKKGDDKYCLSRDLRVNIRPYLFTDFDTEQLKEFARNIHCPFLIIKAKDTQLYEPKELYLEFLDIYQNASSNFQYVEVPGRHHVHLSNPSIVAPHIIKFLYGTNKPKL